MKHEFATDTMGLVLRLERRRLPQRVKQIFEDIERRERTLSIPVMVLAENRVLQLMIFRNFMIA